MGFWNPSQDRQAREDACIGTYSPYRYTVRVNDDHDRWKYRIAAHELGLQGVPLFFVWCAEYVIRHNRRLKGVRRSIRYVEREARKAKRRERLARKASKL